MDLKKACQLLEITPSEIHTPILKKKYKHKCLRYHPDKNGDKEKFVELKQAYDFLSQQPKPSTFLDEMDESLLRKYLYSIYRSDLEFFKHPLFVRYFIDPVKNHLHEFKEYILHPTLEQLLRKDIYYLEEEKLYIPLWHEEITFHGKIKVTLEPKIPEGFEIDEQNNIRMPFDQNQSIIVIGSISISMTEQEKKEKRIKGKGIPRIQSSIYDASELSDIILI